MLVASPGRLSYASAVDVESPYARWNDARDWEATKASNTTEDIDYTTKDCETIRPRRRETADLCDGRCNKEGETIQRRWRRKERRKIQYYDRVGFRKHEYIFRVREGKIGLLYQQ
jgi:hypothetical protein